jgi:enoyl-CoA hydratase/carnithine racemase
VPTLERDGDIFVLNLGEGENRFNPDWVAAVQAHLDEVEAAPPPRALVTAAAGKFWSNGLDLEWMAANSEAIAPFISSVQELFARFLGASVGTVAALQGHVFAAGAMLALAHDQRVMRSDRGFFCLPEVDIRIPFTPGMTALVAGRLPMPVAHEAMTTGRRYGGTDAAGAGIVDQAAEEGEVLERALERARPLADKDPTTLGTIKQRLYADAIALLRS